jgi:ferredoxin
LEVLVMVKVDAKKCIGCGACAAVCPDGFVMKSDGKSHVKNPKAKCIDEAADACPVGAISK